ncbi:MAG: hypothetical protein ACOZBW_00625 [Thermodesulfobacteriota bacterium]
MSKNKDNEYLLENVWENKAPELKNEIIEFWMKHNALPNREIAQERVRQVFCIGRDGANHALAGLGTVYEKYNPQLENSFYYYRSFVAPEHRRSLLATNILLHTRDFLENAFIKKDLTKCIGMFMEVENEALQKLRNQAVWPYSGFVYIGKNEKGYHLRVYYFKGALIS